MDKEKLEKKFAQLLNISNDDKSFAFTTFKEKLTDQLGVGEAIKIDNLGVFQLKEQLNENKSESSTRKKTLLFSPDKSIADTDSLFLTLEVGTKTRDSVEFDEKVFQLGIGKPLRKLDQTGASENKEDPMRKLENKIDDIINKAEKIKNFDLWEDYLEGKESQSILQKDKSKNDFDPFFDDDLKINGDTEHIYENDFEELDDEEIFNELMDDGNLNSDELADLTSDVESELKPDEIFESINKDNILEPETVNSENFDQEQIKENEVEEFVEKNLNNYLEEKDFDLDENDDDDQFGLTSEKDQNENIEKLDKPALDSVDSLKEIKQKAEIKPKLTTEEFSESLPGKISTKKMQGKKYSPFVSLLLALFIMIAAIGAYYLFFKNPTWLYDKHEVEVALSEKHAEELKTVSNNIDETATDKEKAATSVQQNEQKNIEEQKTDPSMKAETEKLTPSKIENNIKKVIETPKVVQKNNDEILVLESSKNETEVSKNIYFDGTTYSVQISSWKQKSIADNEVKKLLKKGFPAFIVKSYIKKFNDTWNRVRIGPYPTIGEAETNQSKLK